MTVQWPDWRADICAALEVLASDPLQLDAAGRDPRRPGLTEAVHWLVDDTWWDHQEPSRSIGTVLHNEPEAIAVGRVVRAIVAVSERHGANAPDVEWFADQDWAQVQDLAQAALTALRNE